MSFLTNILDVAGINKQALQQVVTNAGVTDVVKQLQEPVMNACKQGAKTGVREYATPLVLGLVGLTVSLIGVGIVIGRKIK